MLLLTGELIRMSEFLKQMKKYGTNNFQNSRLVEHMIDPTRPFDNECKLLGLKDIKVAVESMNEEQNLAITRAINVISIV
jgi:hypothetical protein